jgi:hypothetical protein
MLKIDQHEGSTAGSGASVGNEELLFGELVILTCDHPKHHLGLAQ